ncbi:hypothetical protein lerEdw1_010254 [Lerista edwardsae]|nr:hypothetical protein lerEdw1_010254 [Lerista edwardsae]
MDSARMCGFLAAGCLLLLTLLGDPTEACSCAPTHPQTAYCNADVVIRAKFVGDSMEFPWKRFEIKTAKVYKGSEALQELRFLYTSTVGHLCGYEKEPRQGEDYVIAGKQYINRTIINLCSFIQPWAELSPEQRRGLSLDYSKGCSCTVSIKPCYSTPCSIKSDSLCLWDQNLNGIQAKTLACLPKSGIPHACSWQSLNS